MELGQIRMRATKQAPNDLAIHAIRPDRKPGCGDPVRDFEGEPAEFVPLKADTRAKALQECPESIGLCGRNGCFPA